MNVYGEIWMWMIRIGFSQRNGTPVFICVYQGMTIGLRRFKRLFNIFGGWKRNLRFEKVNYIIVKDLCIVCWVCNDFIKEFRKFENLPKKMLSKELESYWNKGSRMSRKADMMLPRSAVSHGIKTACMVFLPKNSSIFSKRICEKWGARRPPKHPVRGA